MGDVENGKAEIIFRITIGLLIALSAVLPTLVDILVEIFKIVKIVTPDSQMTVSEVGGISLEHIKSHFMSFFFSGLAAIALHAAKFGYPNFHGWLKALYFFILCHFLGVIAEFTIELIRDGGFGAIVAGIFWIPVILIELPLRSTTITFVWFVCFVLTQFIAIGLRKRLYGTPN